MTSGGMAETRRPEHRPGFPAALAELRSLLGDRVSTGPSVLAQHGRDESWHEPHMPDAVTFPETTEEVSSICRICHRHDVPVIPFGIGSSVEGALIPVLGGVVVDLTRMTALLRVDAQDFSCTVQPGLQRRALNEQLRDTGLFFPVDPGADATVGGMASTRASGTNAVRYGTMMDNVRALEVVLADGRVIRTGTRARKSAAGYDLTRLFVGSEGTLGIITELTLRLSPIPDATASATCSFETLEGAIEAAVVTMQSGLPVARLELLDEVMIDAVNLYSGLDLPAVPHLFFEFHGGKSLVADMLKEASAIAADFGGGDFRASTDPDERARLWQARHDCAYACMAYSKPRRMMTTDVCVPLSQLAGSIRLARRSAAEAGILAPILGHVGDGNYHMALLIDPADADEVERAQKVNDAIVEQAISVGGTCTGEHGVGLGKMRYLRREHGEGVDVMHAIKAALDPKSLMNPGKVLP